MTHAAGLMQPTDRKPFYVKNYHERLEGIVAQIRSCDDVLKQRRLEPAIAYIAHRLIAIIEQQLDQLGQITSQSLPVAPESRQGWMAKIERQLDNLGLMCDQLVAAIADRPSDFEMIAV